MGSSCYELAARLLYSELLPFRKKKCGPLAAQVQIGNVPRWIHRGFCKTFGFSPRQSPGDNVVINFLPDHSKEGICGPPIRASASNAGNGAMEKSLQILSSLEISKRSTSESRTIGILNLLIVKLFFIFKFLVLVQSQIRCSQHTFYIKHFRPLSNSVQALSLVELPSHSLYKVCLKRQDLFLLVLKRFHWNTRKHFTNTNIKYRIDMVLGTFLVSPSLFLLVIPFVQAIKLRMMYHGGFFSSIQLRHCNHSHSLKTSGGSNIYCKMSQSTSR